MYRKHKHQVARLAFCTPYTFPLTRVDGRMLRSVPSRDCFAGKGLCVAKHLCHRCRATLNRPLDEERDVQVLICPEAEVVMRYGHEMRSCLSAHSRRFLGGSSSSNVEQDLCCQIRLGRHHRWNLIQNSDRCPCTFAADVCCTHLLLVSSRDL